MQQSFVLVLNCGSSSVKFSVIEPESGENKLSGIIQCIATPEANLVWKVEGKKASRALADIDYYSAVQVILDLISETGDLSDSTVAIGHRVVHGGERFTQSVLIDEAVLNEIKACIPLAPLHNPAHIIGIEAAKNTFPTLPQVAVFDTAFHQTMPEHAYLYALPYSLYRDYQVRRYGFHGTSHLFVSREASKILNRSLDDSAIITAHLGNGCSVCAILNGQSVDTSMGITPLEGLVMGTRSGDVDPSLHAYLAEHLNYDVHQITDLLNKESGLLGISEQFSDMRGIEEAAERGEKRALLTEAIFCYRLAKYIASYSVPLGRIDALVFTGGIGENSPRVREQVLNQLGALNFKVDQESNANRGKSNNGIITQSGSTVAMVVPTNEEWVIAQDAVSLPRKPR